MGRRATTCAGLALLAASGAAAQTVDFGRDVRPIFAEHCLQCHGPDEGERRAELHLDRAESLNDVVVAGVPAESALYLRIASKSQAFRMPPARHSPALAEEEIEILRRWIEAGAEWRPHWAYAPFRRVVPPERDEPHPIDRFVAARLEQEGLEPSPRAERRTLIRRLSLDLVGMIPTPEEIDAFLEDRALDAYERLVDRLLASTHYAERWARHWLDLARYADSNGYTIDGRRPMWPYRDWVVRAIDEGMPFDQFTIEQLAGDLLPNPTNAQLVATGFHRNTQINQEGGAKDEENRVNAVIDRVNTTGAVWLGSTLGCAQCHTHKYDPVSHVDYYRLMAFFDQTADGGVSIGPSIAVTDPETETVVESFEAQRRGLEAELVAAEREAAKGWVVWRPSFLVASEGPELRMASDESVSSIAHNPQTSLYEVGGRAPIDRIAAVRVEALPDLALPAHGPGRARDGGFVLSRLRLLARRAGTDDDFEERALASNGPWTVLAPEGEPHVAVFALVEPLASEETELRLELIQDHGRNHVLGRFRVSFTSQESTVAEVTDRWRSAWLAVVEHEDRRPDLPSTLVMRAQSPPRTTHVLLRGDFRDPGTVVEPGFPPAMSHFPTPRPATRLDLARWLVHPENALVHRVTVNRQWQRFFGLGLVETENDFGLRGSAPSHPDLLEWLASELVAREFSMKALHRLIVTSESYRRSSVERPDLRERDPRNRLLARQSRLRLDAEAIRDSALRASGLLSEVVGGPPVHPPQPDGVFAFTQNDRRWIADDGPDRFRRTLYVRLWRSSPYPFLTTFDAPQPTVTCTRRVPSTTPLQALTLANDPMVLEIARGLGHRLLETPGSDAERIRNAWERALARPPGSEEASIIERHLARRRSGDDEVAAWASLARILFNLDEFSHRN